jgi:hypothetical protein
MEGEGSPSNHEEHPASTEVAEPPAASSSSLSSSKSGKISGLDGFASSRESNNSSSNYDSDECSDSTSGGDVEITLSDVDVDKTDASVEEGEIASRGGVAAEGESGENLAGVEATPPSFGPAILPPRCRLSPPSSRPDVV